MTDLPFRNRLGDYKLIAVTKEVRQHSHSFKLGGNEQWVEHSHLVDVKSPEHIHGEEPDDAA